MRITSSREENKAKAVRILLRQAALSLPADSMILILTQTEGEASKLFSTINSNGEIGSIMKLGNIQFGPLSHPPLSQVYSLVIYCSMPKRIEQLLAQITLLSNNHIYQNYGKLRKLNVTHFHLITDPEDFAKNRLQVFLKAVSELQADRFMNLISQKYHQSSSTEENRKISLSFKEISQCTELQPIGINRFLKHLQGEGHISLGHHAPCSFVFKPSLTGGTHEKVLKLVEMSERLNNIYRASLSVISEALVCNQTDVITVMKALMTEGLLAFETDNELLELQPSKSLITNHLEIGKSIYKALRSENILEGRLLQYQYLILRIGSTPSEQVFNPLHWSKNMVSLLKNYALAEEGSIKNLFPENAERDVMDVVMGDETQLQEADYAFRQLLYRGDDFFPEELSLCKDQEKGSAAREFIRIQMVRSLLGLPGCKKVKTKLGSKNWSTEIQKIDFESLLGRSGFALSEYCSKAK
jgi:hypothetical protein